MQEIHRRKLQDVLSKVLLEWFSIYLKSEKFGLESAVPRWIFVALELYDITNYDNPNYYCLFVKEKGEGKCTFPDDNHNLHPKG